MSALPTLALALLAMEPAPAQEHDLYRRIVAETALAQAVRPDPSWPEDQRDCAGLVRFAYRAAYRALRPERVERGIWRDARGRALSFADAETLLGSSFVSLGRGAEAQRALQSGDLAAFRQPGSEGPQYHLMIVVRSTRQGTVVVYHPGTPGAAVRVGPLGALAKDAPLEWRPLEENPAFLGFFRFGEWMQ